MKRSIRWRIIIPFGILILAVFSFLGFYSANFVRQTYINNLQDKLISNDQLICDALKADLKNKNPQDLIAEKVQYWANLLSARTTIIAPDGLVLADSHQDPKSMVNHLDRPEVQAALTKGQGHSIRFSHTLGYEMLYTAIPCNENNELLGFVRLSIPLNEVDQRIDQLQRVWTIVLTLVSITSIGLAGIIAFKIAKPLRQLTKASQDLVRTSNQNAIPVDQTTDEISQLTRTFNHMALSINEKLAEIESERAKLSTILQEMSDGVIITDRQGTIQLINKAAINLFEVSQAEPIGLTLIEVTRQHQIVELLESCAKNNKTQKVSFEILKTKQFVQAIASPGSDAMPSLFLFIFHDITQERKSELTRRDFISNVSHELRQPLAAIKLLSETLLDGAFDDLPSAKHFLQQIDNEVDSLNNLVNELLELSRAEAGHINLDLRAVNPLDLLKKIQERLHLLAEQDHIDLVIDCPPGLPLIKADKLRLEQVLMNLVHNAIKFSHPGGEILMKAEVGEAELIFSVHDDGIGISEEDLLLVFERFFKADRSRSGVGTGLGLSVARYMVEAHGGKIWAESRHGIGSTFFFTIPLLNTALTLP